MRNILRYVYSRPLQLIVFVILVAVFVWAIINKLLTKDVQNSIKLRNVNIGLLIVEFIVVLYITLFSRTTGQQELCLMPFYSFVLAQEVSEMYRTMLMNVLLFVPLGMTMPYAFQKRVKRKKVITVLCALLFSLLIEIVQYVFGLGRAEVDDIICNTLGAAIGCMSYLLSSIVERKTNTT